ncbi:MAG: cysteine desulfurase family protein [Flavobacteriaceae bacterium]|jgi:cysteine desulfurase|nr:cysteine desulfurase family protein [Flavobacteriaceae bacterium]MDG1911305.1 cysteine desulfurase family protein [Flavobacteriaceae bacterium]
MNVYFDNAATTPLRKEVIQIISNVMEDCFGNPSSVHAFGRTAKTNLETARKGIAKLLNAAPQEIIFTSGGTESDNMILHCAVKDLGVRTIISSKIEHHAILHAMEALKINNGIRTLYVDVTKDGSVDLDHLKALLQSDDSRKLVSLMHVNNEIGNILDLNAVGELCHDNNALFHTDAVQGVGHFTFDMEQLPVDFLSAAAHKFHGPKGVGFSFVRKNSGLQPFIHGGAQERGLRAGTESVHNIVGMQKALELAYVSLEKEKVQVNKLKSYFIEKLRELFPDVIFNGLSGVENKSTYTLVNVALPIPADKSLLLDFHLDLKGVACSKGSACQSGSNSGSHVLKAIQEAPATDWPSLRFSFSIFNTKEEIDYLIQVLKEFLK